MTFADRAAALRPAEIVALLEENALLKQQNAWFKRQLFGRKSERRVREPDLQQLVLGLGLSTPDPAAQPPSPTETVKAYQRRAPFTALAMGADESGLRFDASVPLQEIRLCPPAVTDLPPEAYELIGEKVTYRLAQRPGAYVILKYVRPVVKVKETQALVCTPAPSAVLERSFAEVSLLAGLLVDKFRFHLPLYRQHQRLAAAGIHLSRATLTQWVHRTAALVEPISHALLSSILQSKVLAMDETPIKAGRQAKGKLHTGYFWPVYGDQDEIAFPYAASRAQSVVREALGQFCGVLLTDGYTVYERYAQTVNRIVHAQCWAHCRRQCVDAAAIEPPLVAQALDFMGQLYHQEAQARARALTEEALLTFRAEYAKPLVDAFFAWLTRTLREQVLLPTNPFTKAARYALARERALRVFLEYPTVPLDTNHLEREIRAIAMGRKAWLFLLDGSRGPVCGHRAEPPRFVSPPRSGSVRLPRRCPPAHRYPSRF